MVGSARGRKWHLIRGMRRVRKTRRGYLGGALLVASLAVSPFAPVWAAGKANGVAPQEDKAEKKEAEKGVTDLRVEVTAGEKSEPVDQASVYVKYMEERSLRRDKKVELNLKTNREGVARLVDAPRGKVLIQVIAPGWKTFGKWFDLDQDQQTIKIRLQKPPRWY